jgi:hypothetical protein
MGEPVVMDRQDRIRILAIAGALVIFGASALKLAWVFDDAFITFRTIDNFVGGYGLRWNIAERVQTFTHRLWLMVLTPVYTLVWPRVLRCDWRFSRVGAGHGVARCDPSY